MTPSDTKQAIIMTSQLKNRKEDTAMPNLVLQENHQRMAWVSGQRFQIVTVEFLCIYRLTNKCVWQVAQGPENKFIFSQLALSIYFGTNIVTDR